MHTETQQREQSAAEAEREAGEVAAFDPGQALEAVARVTREHPHAALAGALAIGFVLGGGLTPRIVGAVGMIAARKYLQQGMAEALEGALGGQGFAKR